MGRVKISCQNHLTLDFGFGDSGFTTIFPFFWSLPIKNLPNRHIQCLQVLLGLCGVRMPHALI